MMYTARPGTGNPETIGPAEQAPGTLAHALDIVARFDQELRHVYVNAIIERVTGRPARDFIGRTNAELGMPAELCAQWEEALRAVFRTGEPRDIEFAFETGEGVRWFQSRLTAEPGPAGEVATVVCVSRDITGQHDAEAALRAAQGRLTDLLAHSPTILYALTLVEGRAPATWVSDNVERITGHTLEAALAPGWWVEHLHPEDRERALTTSRALMATGGAHEYRFRFADGSYRWIRDEQGSSAGADGRPHMVIGSWSDVTERRESEAALRASEERFRALIERTSDIVALLDANAVVRYASPAYDRGLGYEVGEVLGRPVLELVHPEDLTRVEETFARLLGRADGVEALEVRLRHGDGSWRAFEIVARNLMENAAVGGIVVSGRDITDRRALEAQLRQAQKMEAVGQLAGGVAHDFNNLLTVIKVHTELALETLDASTPLHADLLEVRKAAARAAALTRQLLAFSRKQLLQPRVLDLNAVVADLQRMLSRLIGEDIRVMTTLAPELGPVLADPGQLEQVLVNLAVNARDAMPEGGTLTIVTADVELTGRGPVRHPVVPRGRYVALSVSDTGCGMPPEVRDRVFEPFFTTKPMDRGTGLGLSTVYGIVRQSGGYIVVESAPGEGTTFTIYLPRAADPAAAKGGSASAAARPRGAETVLLVEDEPAVRTLARRILERQGYQVLAADNGHEALALASSHGGAIDLLVTDMVMPDMSGRALAERLVAGRTGPRILYMSGYTDDEIVRRGLLEAGMRFLQKPFTVDGLAGAVRAALDEVRG